MIVEPNMKTADSQIDNSDCVHACVVWVTLNIKLYKTKPKNVRQI